MVEQIFSGVGNVIGVMNEIGTNAASNEICILFMSFTVVGLGMRMFKRLIRAFGRGR